MGIVNLSLDLTAACIWCMWFIIPQNATAGADVCTKHDGSSCINYIKLNDLNDSIFILTILKINDNVLFGNVLDGNE